MRETSGRNAPQVRAAANYANTGGVALVALEMDVNSQESVDVAAAQIIAEHGASTSWSTGHGPGRGLTKEQFADLYNINVLSSQRVNRAVCPV